MLTCSVLRHLCLIYVIRLYLILLIIVYHVIINKMSTPFFDFLRCFKVGFFLASLKLYGLQVSFSKYILMFYILRH